MNNVGLRGALSRTKRCHDGRVFCNDELSVIAKQTYSVKQKPRRGCGVKGK